MRKKLIFLLTLALLMVALCTQVSASDKPDPVKPCSVTFLLDFDGKPLAGGSLTLHRVGQINAEGNGFVLVEALGDNSPSLDNLQNPELAETLNKLAVSQGLKPYSASVKGGKAVFSDLESGVYVVSQPYGEEIPGYAAINPFLISLPQWKNGAYVYDLTASPKVPLEPASTASTEPFNPTEPDDTPDLPQTGQLNWPVPLMAVGGLALFGLGWSLFFGAKRRSI